ncbi:UNVERIFIED_CONTAM: hypothetical protein Sradi_3419800 [Sesamum radiatum]|uniref:Uncharacterized protein n=1 Tax=Sesamum radiatum TaxID=300843 RepID=A0AAW2R5V3_SESRA
MAIERRKGLIAFKLLVKRLQNHLHISRRVLEIFRRFEFEEVEAKETVPDDVKEGHFAVLAVKNEEKPTRFVAELCLLKQPAFLRLLKPAEEEYGFQQTGVLAVPCPPEELKRILQDTIWKNTNRRDFNTEETFLCNANQLKVQSMKTDTTNVNRQKDYMRHNWSMTASLNT